MVDFKKQLIDDIHFRRDYDQEMCQKVWREKHSVSADRCRADSVERLVSAIRYRETTDGFEELLRRLMLEGVFIPAGRVWSGMGTDKFVTLMNCYVMGQIPDNLAGIFKSLTESALTMQQGGGIGMDFSTLRPKGSLLKRLGDGAVASGPLSFMEVWDSMCRTIMSAGSRRGAMMATLRCDHPDVRLFIEAKSDPKRLRMFNLSVLITDKFMEAVSQDKLWALVFDAEPAHPKVLDADDYYSCHNYDDAKNKTIYDIVSARELWESIMLHTYKYSDPGVIFIDRMNKRNNLNYCETIYATNPCGEQPLPPYGACDLSQINLARLVKDPFTKQAKFDFKLLDAAAEVGIEFLDLLIDISNYPLPEQKAEMEQKRRVGLGVTGLADCIAQMGLVYGSPESVEFVEDVFGCLQTSAISRSMQLARVKGSFPVFDSAKFDIRTQSGTEFIDFKHGIRNGTLLSVAPTGSVSLSMGYNTSSGVEPNFAHRMKREQLEPDGTFSDHSLYSYLYLLWCAHKNLEPSSDAAYEEFLKEPYAVTTMDISVKDHIAIQAACQKYVDTSISKTINCPPDISFEEFKGIYSLAYDSGCKGCTTYRETEHKPGILQAETKRVTLQAAPVCEETTVGAPEVQKGVLAAVERPNSLEGRTYKIKWPHLSAALYVTINNHNGKPYEIFITSKFLPNQEWTVALTRMISANWRRGGNNDFIFEELQEIQSQGNVGWFDGKMYPSLVAYLGKIISDHCRESGANTERVIAYDSGAEPTVVELDGFAECPKCGARSFVKQEGCGKCLSPSCGHSDCG